MVIVPAAVAMVVMMVGVEVVTFRIVMVVIRLLALLLL